MIVRDVKPTDYEQWLPLWDGYNAFYGREGPTALPIEITKATWSRFFDAGEPVHAFVAEDKGKLIGLVHYLYHRSTTMIEPICYLQDLFTSKEALGEAEALVRSFRDRYDPSAALGVPAHITLLYPFKPPDQIEDAVIERLSSGFGRFAPISFSLASIQRFPCVVYLTPAPAEPFRALTRAIWSWYPETPPYGGKWPDIIPHLSVASIADAQVLDRLAEEFAQASAGILPVRAIANEVTLLEKRAGSWRTRATFALRG